MKILNILIILYLCCYISGKNIVPKSTAQKHKSFIKKQRKAQTSNATSCYENCRNQQSQTHEAHRIKAGQKQVYHNTMNTPEDKSHNWRPSGILGPIYGAFKDTLKTGTMLTSDTLGAKMQMENDLYQAQSRVEYNKQLQEQQLEAQKLHNDALLEEERIKANDKIYNEQQSSPYYQEQMAEINNGSPSFKLLV